MKLHSRAALLPWKGCLGGFYFSYAAMRIGYKLLAAMKKMKLRRRRGEGRRKVLQYLWSRTIISRQAPL